jgi:hypothetical protein
MLSLADQPQQLLTQPELVEAAAVGRGVVGDAGARVADAPAMVEDKAPVAKRARDEVILPVDLRGGRARDEVLPIVVELTPEDGVLLPLLPEVHGAENLEQDFV